MVRTDKPKAELWAKYKGVVLILAAGILLLIWPGGKEDGKIKEKEQETVESLTETEEQMEALLSRIEGVGQLELMLTLETAGRQELAMDTELSYSGQTASPED